MATAITITIGIKRIRIIPVGRIANTHNTLRGKQMPVSRIAGGHHAIEHIDA